VTVDERLACGAEEKQGEIGKLQLTDATQSEKEDCLKWPVNCISQVHIGETGIPQKREKGATEGYWSEDCRNYRNKITADL